MLLPSVVVVITVFPGVSPMLELSMQPAVATAGDSLLLVVEMVVLR